MNMVTAQRTLPACLLFAVWATPAAESPVQALQPVEVIQTAPTVRLVFDCDARTLPSQRLVGEALDQHNQGQVYASRARLMTEVGRACQRPGTERVGLVLLSDPPRARVTDRRVARQDPPSR